MDDRMSHVGSESIDREVGLLQCESGLLSQFA